MQPVGYSIAAVLPHEPPMILLDHIVSRDAHSLTAAVVIDEDSLFLDPEGVPAHIGIEYMAQACGAFAGAQALDDGAPVRVGFLLGTRRYRASVPWFRRGDRLAVVAAVSYRDETMGSFDCRIERDGVVLAEAQLNVYQPPHPVGGAAP